MPGFNHYANCACGWCVNDRRNKIDRNELSRRDAESFLKRNSANSIAGCYVNPNAQCPVCGTAVFFYSNEFGSKVYFDDLGPPWPKHPCTDNPRQRIEGTRAIVGVPTRRANGLKRELVSNARTAGLLGSGRSEDGAPEWQLLIVVAVKKSGQKNFVVVENLTVEASAAIKFHCYSESPIFEVGDFISKKGDQISFLYRSTLTAITFKEGSVVQLPQPVARASLSSPIKAALMPRPRAIKIAAKPRKLSIPSKYEMRSDEMEHYHTNRISVKSVCIKLEPIIKAYARAGIRKPRDVAVHLNAEGYRTANGSHWTPRLTHFLLGLIFLESTPIETKKVAQSIPKSANAPSERTLNDKVQPTQTDMVRRLSVLGRVFAKEK